MRLLIRGYGIPKLPSESRRMEWWKVYDKVRHSGVFLAGIQGYAIACSVERFGSDSSGFRLKDCRNDKKT